MPRPLLDRLHDLEAALRVGGWVYFEKDIREAIEELQRREKLMQSVDVNLAESRATLP